MHLSKRKLNTYQRYYQVVLHPIDEFTGVDGHPVVLYRESHADKNHSTESWFNLICPCDLTWKWKKINGKRGLVHTANGFKCPAKEVAREVVRNRLREKYREVWAAMPLPDAAHDIYMKHCVGEYLGEHNPGTLYVQDLERLLGTFPEVRTIHLGEVTDEKGRVTAPRETVSVSMPGREILTAVSELKKRKLLDLNGMILVPYKEYFRFPKTLHHQFAYWIEEPLGWPNGDAGDIFMSELCSKIAAQTGWTKGEDVFGEENIPDLPEASKKRGIKMWLSHLDFRLSGNRDEDKSVILRRLSLEEWIAWLTMIREEIHAPK